MDCTDCISSSGSNESSGSIESLGVCMSMSLGVEMGMDKPKTVLVLRDGVREDYVNAWDITRYVPCEETLWMQLVGPGRHVATAHMTGHDTLEDLQYLRDESMDIILDVRGLSAALDYGRRGFWEGIHRKLSAGGSFMGCKSTLTSKTKFRDGVLNLFDGGRYKGNFCSTGNFLMIKRQCFVK